jgi:hypothetical protein
VRWQVRRQSEAQGRQNAVQKYRKATEGPAHSCS